MELTSDTFKTLSKKIKKTFWVLGLHAFSLILFLVFIDIIWGGFIFYKDVFLAENEEPQVTGNIIRFDKGAYQDVLKELQANSDTNNESLQIQPPTINLK